LGVALPPDRTITQPVRAGQFFDVVGEQAGLFGTQEGSLEGFVYPLKLFRDLRLSFELGGKLIPGATVAQRITSTPGSVEITYSGDEFQVFERLIVPVDQPGASIQLSVHSYSPLTLHLTLVPDFQLMWPAAFGSGYASWSKEKNAFIFGADGQPFAAILGGDEMTPEVIAGSTDVAFSLGTINGIGSRTLALAGSIKSQAEAFELQRKLMENRTQLEPEAAAHYRRYLDQTVSVELPDAELQQAYDDSRLSLAKEMVKNPYLGRGLVAGYGLSRTAYRPGYSWFFGRDSFWSSFALNSVGDWQNSKAAIQFVANFQRSDGKMPHEISQSASLVPWAKDYPYLYASADATPLFITAVRDYVGQSGDVAFAREMWDRVTRAMAFSDSTLNADGFPKNYQVGHGWVEGGPLLPVEVETYMAGCYVEAVHSLSDLAKWTGHDADADRLRKEYGAKKALLNQRFWLQDTGDYAYAIGLDKKPVVLPTVLAMVPEWWELFDVKQAQSMGEHLAEEEHTADWGVRIISNRAKLYNPSGYHFGSVWPLFTGWASLASYHAHLPGPGWENLKANSWLAHQDPNGNTTEVLSGQTDTPLSTSTPHQTWSAAMIIAPLLRGLFGLEVNSVQKHVVLRPQLPADWNDAAIRGVHVADGTMDFALHRDAHRYTLKVTNHGVPGATLRFGPAYSAYTVITGASVNGRAASVRRSDWNASLDVSLPPEQTTIELRHDKLFGVAIPAPAPITGQESSNLKLISEHWDQIGKRVLLHVSGRAGHQYTLPVAGGEYIAKVTGAARSGTALTVTLPPGKGYVAQDITITLN
jgi:glycogen debranching enzyme